MEDENVTDRDESLELRNRQMSKMRRHKDEMEGERMREIIETTEI